MGFCLCAVGGLVVGFVMGETHEAIEGSRSTNVIYRFTGFTLNE